MKKFILSSVVLLLFILISGCDKNAEFNLQMQQNSD